MPIYTQSYRTYGGDVRGRFRWWTIVQHELRILFRMKTFVILVILGYLHACFRVLQIVTYDTLNTTPNNPLAQALRQIQMFTVDETMFFDFIRAQSFLVFLATILAGAGMICNDFRNNLMEIYFSKPMTWRDYVMGKIMTLILVGLVFTAIPAVLLVVVHNAMAPSLDTLKATCMLPVAILGFSLALVGPCALGVLATSALSRSQRYASIAIFMLLFGDFTIGGILPELLHQRNYAIIAFPLAVNHVGEMLFHQKHPSFDLSWGGSVLYIAVVCAGALYITCRIVRRAEMAA